MRLAANEYEIKEYERIDKLAEVDQKAFWKVVKSKRSKKQNVNTSNEMKFNDVLERQPDNILKGWCDYFRKLYTFSNDINYDDGFKNDVENDVNEYLKASDMNYISKYLTNVVTYNELAEIISSLPNAKSASIDNLTYEHIKYGGKVLTECLVQLFNAIIQAEQVPKSFKEGITVTLHKGSGKPKTDPNNYRAISLLPVIFKLFEKMLLTRFEKIKFQEKLHPLQHGFQKGKSSKMVSFLYQEAVNYTIERNDVIFTCFMDALKAFDRTWIYGLLHKLFSFGIRGKALKIFNDILTGASSRVLAFGHLSDRFEIHQGTRQGSILSPLMYTVFIDGLLHLLEQSAYGVKLNNISLCAPTQADDIVLMSLTKHGLSKLLEIANTYANKWRYEYNASKCAYLVLNQRNSKAAKANIMYANKVLSEVSNYKHLGIDQSKRRKTPASVDDVRQSARGTLFSLINCGIHSNGVNPITAAKLYTSIVLPRALFGCELWNSITQTDHAHLEATHHFCLKRIQSLPQLTRSDMMATGLLGFTSIEAYIDLQNWPSYARCVD